MGIAEQAVEVDGEKLMQFVFRAVDEVGAALNARIGVRLHGVRDWTVPALKIDSRRPDALPGVPAAFPSDWLRAAS